MKYRTDANPYRVPGNARHVHLVGVGQVVKLPAGAEHAGRVTVKDDAGTATASPITIYPAAGETVDGEAYLSLDNDRAAVTLAYAGGNWSIT